MNAARQLVAGLLAVAAFSVAACAPPQSTSDTLELALKTTPNQLDPALVVDVAEGEICAMLFQGLVRFSPEGEIEPDLARSWEITTGEHGGSVYVFHLDTRNTFANGRPVTAADVIFSFERVLSPSSRSSRKWVLDRIRGAGSFAGGETPSVAGISAPDDSTVVVVLEEPFFPFLSMLALPAAMVVPRELLSPVTAGAGFETFAGLPVGSGRWRLKVWERGDYLLLEPNVHFPRPAAVIAAIRFRIIPEAFTRVAEFESGTLDILEIPPAELPRYLDASDEKYTVQSRPEHRVFYIGLNNTRPPFDDARVRRALNMAVDVDRMIEVLAGGQAIRAKGAIPPGLSGYSDREGYVYDRDEARRLLSAAGYPDGFKMEIWQRESPEGNRLLEAVQGYLSQAGIEVTLVRREWSAFKEAVSAGRVDAFYLDWVADYPNAENFLYPLFCSQNAGSGGNRAFFADSLVDRLMVEAGRMADEREAAQAYARIDELVYRQAPWIYLYFPRSFRAVSRDVSGYTFPSLYLGNDYTTVRKNKD